MFSGLMPASPLTVRMFDDERGQKLRRVSEAVDAINRKHGRDAVSFAAARTARGWESRAGHAQPALHDPLGRVDGGRVNGDHTQNVIAA